MHGRFANLLNICVYVSETKVCDHLLTLTTVCSCEIFVATAIVFLFVKLEFLLGSYDG